MRVSALPARLAAACLFAVLAPAASKAWSEDLEGRVLFTKNCGACHTSEKNGSDRQGPNLHGVVSRAAGTKEGFAYSEAFLAGKDGIVWDQETLDRWIVDPQGMIPGGIMLFRQKDPAVRARLIDYLETLH